MADKATDVLRCSNVIRGRYLFECRGSGEGEYLHFSLRAPDPQTRDRDSLQS